MTNTMRANMRIHADLTRLHEFKKFPAITMMASDEREFVFRLAGERSKYPGSVTITGPGSFEERAFYGRIDINGRFWPKCPDATAAIIINTIDSYGADRTGMAHRHGRKTGNCCFCGTQLTDDRPGYSIERGYGPICAARLGLPHGPYSDVSTPSQAMATMNLESCERFAAEQAAEQAPPGSIDAIQAAQAELSDKRVTLIANCISSWLNNQNDSRSVADLAADINRMLP